MGGSSTKESKPPDNIRRLLLRTALVGLSMKPIPQILEVHQVGMSNDLPTILALEHLFLKLHARFEPPTLIIEEGMVGREIVNDTRGDF